MDAKALARVKFKEFTEFLLPSSPEQATIAAIIFAGCIVASAIHNVATDGDSVIREVVSK